MKLGRVGVYNRQMVREPPSPAMPLTLRRISLGLWRRVKRIFRTEYGERLSSEQAYYRECEVVHDLPPIFHYWSNKHLLPVLQGFGITNPEQFFLSYSRRQCEQLNGKLTRMVSIGCGNGDMEVRIASELVRSNIRNFVIECLDINRTMLKRGKRLARDHGVSCHLEFDRGDFNRWAPVHNYDVVIANQSLHHVLNLEHLLQTIRCHLSPNGVLLTSDTIGRNGHRRWPEATEALRPFWEELPRDYKFNRQVPHREDELTDPDWSMAGFEGVRAQDILPLLTGHFQFELFIPFANIILTIVDRAYGYNFDPDRQWDRDFVDRVHARDQEGLMNGELKPTQMLAVLRNEPVKTRLVHPQLTPEFCVRQRD
jgi:2-polyprenyl-3-methyl-5-hydroxy-6-metoxy-1,4-benzoquinol methylase